MARAALAPEEGQRWFNRLDLVNREACFGPGDPSAESLSFPKEQYYL